MEAVCGAVKMAGKHETIWNGRRGIRHGLVQRRGLTLLCHSDEWILCWCEEK